MPELPEVAAHAERLSAALSGASLARFEPLHPAALKTFDPRPAAAAGQVVASLGHRGKYLLVRFGSTGGSSVGGLTFVVHLMQAGRLRIDTRQTRKPRGGMARWTFADGTALLLTEAGTERRAGVWLVAGDPGEAEPLARLGPDAHTIGPRRARPAPGRGQRARPRLPARPVASGRHRAAAGQRGDPLGSDLALRQHVATRRWGCGSPARRHLRVDRAGSGRGAHARRHGPLRGPAQRRTPPGGPAVPGLRRHGALGRVPPVSRGLLSQACQTGGKVLADNTTSRFLK